MDHPGYNRTVCLHNCRVQNHSHPRWRHKNQKQLDDAVFVLKGSGQVTETQIVLFQAEQGHATDNQESLYLISADQAASVLWKFRF